MTKIREWFFLLWNGGLDPKNTDIVVLRERRIFSSMVMALSPSGFIIIASNYAAGAGGDNIYILIGLTIVFSSLFVQAFFKTPMLAVNLVLFGFWMMPAAIMQSYGVQGTTMMWLLPISAIGVLISGLRNGLLWAFICALTIAVYGYLHASGQINFDYVNHIYVPQAGVPNAIDGIFLIAISTGAAILFRKRQAETELKLRNSVDKLESEVLSRRLAEQDAKLSEQSKSAFLAAMSHEIRTPLNGVITATRLLVDAKSDADRNEFSTIVQESSETLLELVSNVMDLSAMESGKLTIDSEAMSPREVVSNTLRPFHFQAEQKGIDLELTIDDDVPNFIYADKTRAKQILINLVGNAVKFTNEGKVCVQLSMELDKIVLAITDTGVGISEAEQSKLFEPFVQANSSTRGTFGGSGLGLTIVKKIVSAVNGNITLKSELGKGSTFSVYIPHTVPSAESIAKLKEKDAVVESLAPLDLLIADDNAVNRMVLTRLLENDKHRVVAVNDGQEALNYIKAHSVDAVLMDIQMPIMNGEEAASEIRQLPQPQSSTPIIAITANASHDDAQRLLSHDFDGFLAKPFRREELVVALRAADTLS